MWKNNLKRKKKGFTLIELLVVIAILGLLSTLAVVALGNARMQARDAKRRADLRQMATAIQLYLDNNDGVFPDVVGSVGSLKEAVVSRPPLDTEWDDFLDAELQNMPIDPLKGTLRQGAVAVPPLAYFNYVYIEPNANLAGGAININPTNFHYLFVPIEIDKGAPVCDGMFNLAPVGNPSGSTLCQNLEIGCKADFLGAWGTENVWICIRF